MKASRKLGTRQEVADYLDVPLSTMVRWAYVGSGPPYIKVGRHVRYRWVDIEAWLDAQTTGRGGAA